MDAPRTPEELQKLRVVDLRKELSSHALPTTGKKDELVARLHKHLVSLAQETASTEDAGPSGEVGEPMEVDGSLAQQAEEERVAAEAAKLEQENEGRRLAEEKKAAEEAAEKAAQLEQQRLEEEKQMAEEQKLAEERQLAERAVAEKAAEEKAAAEKAAEEKAAAEKAAQEKAAEEKAAQEKAAAEKAAEEKAAEERRLAEQKQQAEVQQKIAAAEQLRLSQEQEALQAVAQQRTQQVPDMMLLVQQQQALLDKQKTAHEANLRQGRQLQEQRQQLEAALRQNSQLQSENKGNQQMMEQLQQHRQQLLAQGEAISSQQSAVSEQATDYVEQRERNERLIKQVMEQQQLKESEEQKMLLLERQQRLLADHEQLQTAQQQAMEQQAKNAELLRQQQVALLERQREQEQAALQLQEQHRQQQIEAEQRRAEAMQREAEARKQKEEAAAAAKLQSERLLEQERVKAAAPPSLLTMETKPAAAGLKLTAGDDQADRKLPKALEDVLALKDIRAKQVGVEDMDLAVQGSRSTVSVRSAVSQQRPLGDVNEYDDDEDDEGKSSRGKESKNKKRKKKKKSRAARKAEEKRAADERAAAASEEGVEIDSGVEVEYVPEKPLVGAGDPLYSQFHKIFESFKIDESVNAGGDESSAEASKPKKETETETGVPRRGAALFGELENEDEGGNKPDSGKLSKKQMKKLTRMSVADLKTVVVRPDLVEMHDVTAPDPRLLLSLKATRNTVAVPRHWCNKRKYLQGKRGFEKPPFELPDYIKATGIMEMRQALADKESDKSLKQKMREKVRPKMGKIDIDYQKLHDAFFKFQRKPRMTVHGDLYYEGKEFETKLREKKPGNLTDDLRTALGMPIGSGAEKFPPPWLIAMQRYGPPPSYPNLKIPGLNAPIPEGCNFGYHAGGWGKPPVDETGRPLYGDVFGQREDNEAEPVSEDAADKGHWGEMESESEEESESESEGEEVADEETMATGIVTPADAGLITPSGLTSIPAGLETPDAIELRKKIEDSMDAGGGDTPALYQVLPEKKASVGTAMMGSAHTYDVGATKKMTADGVEVSLNPEELDMDSSAMQAKYEQTVRAQQADVQKEDFSDMVAEHSAKAAKKRKKQQTSDKSSKKHKEFKF